MEEWELMQKTGSTCGGTLTEPLALYISVQPTLLNFFLNVKDDLYLLQIDAKKLGNGLAYEAVGDTNVFPHFYGPSRSFSPLPLDTVIKGEKLVVPDGKFVCSMLS
ncbi:uncharacterized protein LOC125807547 [Solanum verrucosum]|uniref:uncharacterized protein LOC125807547 n=1 Tax=Solanum verrucosum TaxID=315347 RepID=UPI0020D1EB94|nr:uncharacterized protein LOC125807547 [Solanum verrucosum]